jgi:hypothetical protein
MASMLELLLNWEGYKKIRSYYNLKYYPANFLTGLRKIKKNLP